MISIIIPTLNEEAILDKTLSKIHCQTVLHEIIVSDGGSKDKTLQVASSHAANVTVIVAAKGRAAQMNEGAKIARGEILLFLHADTFLEPDALEWIEKQMLPREVVAGSFYLLFDKKSFALSLYSMFSKINHLLFTYGDQAIFMKREVFISINGYADLPIMEDVEIQKRLRALGKFIKLQKPVTTSSRRFIRSGIFWQQIKNIVLVGLYLAGVSPLFLKRFYKDEGS